MRLTCKRFFNGIQLDEKEGKHILDLISWANEYRFSFHAYAPAHTFNDSFKSNHFARKHIKVIGLVTCYKFKNIYIIILTVL